MELVPAKGFNGQAEFVRVLGTTGSHVAGAKENVYGDVERVTIPTRNLSIFRLAGSYQNGC